MIRFAGKRKTFILLLFFGIAVVFCCALFLKGGFESKREQQSLYSDIDGDGDEEKIVLLWKKGRFGKHKPFWIGTDDNEDSQHIFIYDVLENGELKPKWFASDIGREVVRMKMIGPNGDTLLLEDTEGKNTLWRWESWGLKNVENEVELIAFGDNIIHQEMINYAERYENGDYSYLYEDLKKEIQEADIAAFDAETVLVDNKNAVGGYPDFGSPLEVGEAIADAGFDIAVCGNNHALDRGIYGIDVTTSYYDNKGIMTIGIQNSSDLECIPYKLISRNGLKFAWFSYTYDTNEENASDKYPYVVHYLPRNDAEREGVRKAIEKAKEEADFVIIFAHWGDEYESQVNEFQEDMANFFASAGADVVIGSHPHVIQKTDMIENNDGRKTLVFYSLGNFRAYQGRRDDTKVGAEAVIYFEHCFDGARIKSYEIKEINAFSKGLE